MTLENRLLAKVETDDGCWLWQGAKNAGGYGQIKVAGKVQYAHRVSYELFVGLIPEGLQLDHLCRRRGCVRPEHLEAVTPRENALRGAGFAAVQAKQTHCKYGHPLNGDNVYSPPSCPNRRCCRICIRERQRARRISMDREVL